MSCRWTSTGTTWYLECVLAATAWWHPLLLVEGRDCGKSTRSHPFLSSGHPVWPSGLGQPSSLRTWSLEFDWSELLAHAMTWWFSGLFFFFTYGRTLWPCKDLDEESRMAEKSSPVQVDKLSGPRAAGVIRLEVGNFFRWSSGLKSSWSEPFFSIESRWIFGKI